MKTKSFKRFIAFLLFIICLLATIILASLIENMFNIDRSESCDDYYHMGLEECETYFSCSEQPYWNSTWKHRQNITQLCDNLNGTMAEDGYCYYTK